MAKRFIVTVEVEYLDHQNTNDVEQDFYAALGDYDQFLSFYPTVTVNEIENAE